MKRLLLLLVGATAAPAIAAPAAALSGLERYAAPVEDARLAEQRGKFITPAGIGYFGVEMKSNWLGADGTTTQATLLFSVNFANGSGTLSGATPQLHVGYDRSKADPSLEVSPQNPRGGMVVAAGLGSVRGAVQSQQIAGDDNRVVNGMNIVAIPNGNVVGEASTAGLTAATGSSEVAFADGNRIQFVANGNQLAIQMTDADSNVVRQGVDGTVGQAAQNVVLMNSGNHVANGMSLTIGYDPQAAASAVNLSSMGALRGIGL
jgi:hypothetical protein